MVRYRGALRVVDCWDGASGLSSRRGFALRTCDAGSYASAVSVVFGASLTVSFGVLVGVGARASRGTRRGAGAAAVAAVIRPGFDIFLTAGKRVGGLSSVFRA